MAFSAQECGADDADVACSDVDTEKTGGYEKDTSKHLFFLRQYNFGTGVAPLITLKHKNATFIKGISSNLYGTQTFNKHKHSLSAVSALLQGHPLDVRHPTADIIIRPVALITSKVCIIVSIITSPLRCP